MKGFLGALGHLFAVEGQPLWDPWQLLAGWDLGCSTPRRMGAQRRDPLTSSRGWLPSSLCSAHHFLCLLWLDMTGRNSPRNPGKCWEQIDLNGNSCRHRKAQEFYTISYFYNDSSR